jgi:hypothetical protein
MSGNQPRPLAGSYFGREFPGRKPQEKVGDFEIIAYFPDRPNVGLTSKTSLTE